MSKPLFPTLPPLSLYIHFPWCVQKCPYCDFNSHALREEFPEDAYIDQLIHDFQQDLPYIQGRKIESIFCGGGTPSLFSAEALTKLFESLRQDVDFAEDIEITLEANPGTVEQDRFKGYREVGINRLSLGVQSWQDDKLKKLGRIHDGEQALKAIDAINGAGFDNFNIDIMFGLPEQNIEQALNDLLMASKQKPTHISWYQLTLEPNTLFYKQPPVLPADDEIWEMQLQGQKFLQEQGYQQYEVSAYAHSNLPCRHNLNYWQFGDYIGIGAGAHGKLTSMEEQCVYRTMKHKHPKRYLSEADTFCQSEIRVSEKDLTFEFMLNALRLNKPIAFDLFERRTGILQSKIDVPLQKLAADNFIEVSKTNFSLTPLGRRFLNDVLVALLP